MGTESPPFSWTWWLVCKAAQNYFRRLAPKQLLWLMVEVAAVHNTCKTWLAHFLASKPEVTHTHLYHLPGACPVTPELDRAPVLPPIFCFLATTDSVFIASKRELTCWFMIKKFVWGHKHGCDNDTVFLQCYCFGNIRSKPLSKWKKGLNRRSLIIQPHTLNYHSVRAEK